LLEWVKRSDIDSGRRDGVTTSERERIKAMEREIRELRRANEILKSASAFFAQAALDRPAPEAVWGRANLQSFANCPVCLLQIRNTLSSAAITQPPGADG